VFLDQRDLVGSDQDLGAVVSDVIALAQAARP
jgi:hypothetical protein